MSQDSQETAIINSKDLFPYPSIEKLSRLLIGPRENNRTWVSHSNVTDIKPYFEWVSQYTRDTYRTDVKPYLDEFKRQSFYGKLQVKCIHVEIPTHALANSDTIIYSKVVFLTRQLYFTEEYNCFRKTVLMCNNRRDIPLPIELWLHIFSYIEASSHDSIYHVVEYSEKYQESATQGAMMVPTITNAYTCYISISGKIPSLESSQCDAYCNDVYYLPGCKNTNMFHHPTSCKKCKKHAITVSCHILRCNVCQEDEHVHPCENKRHRNQYIDQKNTNIEIQQDCLNCDQCIAFKIHLYNCISCLENEMNFIEICHKWGWDCDTEYDEESFDYEYDRNDYGPEPDDYNNHDDY